MEELDEAVPGSGLIWMMTLSCCFGMVVWLIMCREEYSIGHPFYFVHRAKCVGDVCKHGVSVCCVEFCSHCHIIVPVTQDMISLGLGRHLYKSHIWRNFE